MSARPALALLLLLVPGLALASEPKPLEGDYFIAGRTVVDPPADEPRDTHLYLTLRGATARDLYARLKTTPRPFPCVEGAQAKAVGGTLCWVAGKGRRAECVLGINLQTQRVDAGLPC